MKRLRDDGYVTKSQIKRPFGSSRGESYGHSQSRGGGGGEGVGRSAAGGSGSTQKLTTNDALSYLKEVKEKFQDQREKYDMFLDVMKDFKAQRIDTTGVIARVKELFKGHPNLILGFNTFLPKGCEITLMDEEEAPPKRTIEFEEAISFVNKIKKRFENDDHVYKSFLEILNMYRREHKGITEVYQEVTSLFEGHRDLLDEFTRFLPDNSATTAAPQTAFGRHVFHYHDERSSVMTATVRQPCMDKGPDGDDDKTTMKLHKGQKKRVEKESIERRHRDQNYREPVSETNGDAAKNSFAEKVKPRRKNEEVGGRANITTYEDKDSFRNMYNQEFTFCEKVKERLRSQENYQSFLKCLHIYSTEIITRKELQGLVSDLIGKYPDLMEGFDEFLERCERIDGFLAGVMSKKSMWNGHSWRHRGEDKEQKSEIDKEKERCKEKYWQKSIQELDLSNCQRCTPSYRLLPDDYPIPSASQRSELGAQVFNDHWVSVTSGSEDYSFKHMRKNQYEESLFRCEDDRFELDMLLESVSSTARSVEELLNRMNDNSIVADGPIRIEDKFTALNLRCIERLYGDHGLDVMDIMRKNPSTALPVILTRLKQKEEEWSNCRQNFNNVWSEIYAKNHYKSLDHRSFYFKQQDSKNLSTKSLITDIKEIKERKEDKMLLANVLGTRYPISPDLVYEYADSEIHEDLSKLIQYSCEEVCSTKEQLNKVLRLWTSFLEPMLGVSPWPNGFEASENLFWHHPPKRTAGGECDGSSAADASGKPSKSISNGDANTSLISGTHCRVSFTNAERLNKEDGQISSERLNNPDAAVTTGLHFSHGLISRENSVEVHDVNSLRPSSSANEDLFRIQSNVNDRILSEVVDPSRSIMSANGRSAEGSRINGYKETSVDTVRNEKEDGKLSPNGDFEEDNFVSYRNGRSQSLPSTNLGSESMQYQIGSGKETCAQDAAGENNSDADEENSENVSEAGEDVSCSESAGDEFSREHEEEEDGEHDEVDGKIESESEAEAEAEAEGTNEDHVTGGESLPSCERFQSSRPLKKYMPFSSSYHENNTTRVFYGNDTFYVLFRLHQALYERLLSAKQHSRSSESKWRSRKDSSSDPYARFLSVLYSLLDGSSDNAKFEDNCRAIIGNQSYVLFTLDKLIYKLIKQLQVISSDELDKKLLQLYDYEMLRKPDKFVDSVYYENVHVVLHEENIYHFERSSSPMRLSIQLVNEGNEKTDIVSVSIDPNFAAYLYNDYLTVSRGKKESSAVVLKRNMRRYATLDESDAPCMAMENVVMVNRLEYKMAAVSSKIYYVLNTEDFFCRFERKKHASASGSSWWNQARVQRFREFLATNL